MRKEDKNLEKTYKEILAELLKIRGDGRPGVYVSPKCRNLISEMDVCEIEMELSPVESTRSNTQA